MKKEKTRSEDLLKFNWFSDPVLNPLGNLIVFAKKFIDKNKNCYLSHLNLMQLASGTIEQITSGDVLDFDPQWSPDGSQISFVRTANRDTQIWVFDLKSRECTPITSLPEGSLGKFLWSPDGKHIVFEFRPTGADWTSRAAEEREKKGRSSPPRVITRLRYKKEGVGFLDNPQHLWVLDISLGAAKQLTHGDRDNRDPVWSPDGGEIAFLSNRADDPDKNPFLETIWITSKDGDRLKQIETPPGYKDRLAWSPDGKLIAYIGAQTQDDPWAERNDRLWVVPVLEGEPSCLTATVDRIVENISISDVRQVGNQGPVWAGDSQSLFYLVSDRGSCYLSRATLEGEVESLISGSFDVSGFSMNSERSRVALRIGYPTRLPELFIAEFNHDFALVSLEDSDQVLNPILEERQLCEPEEVWIQSSDGIQIQGWVYKPPDYDPNYKYPLVLSIHGGPGVQYGNTFYFEFQVFAASGYVVLMTNPRGSLGRDEEFATCIRGNWGDKDYQDLMAAANYGASLPYVDPTRMALMGGSYGGFMVTWIIGHTDRFRCAVAERGVYNRHSAVGTSDFPPIPDGYWEGNAWQNPEKLWQQSPLRLVDQITTPLLLIHSEGDLRCAIEQAEQLFTALKTLGKDVVFLRYPQETNHGFSRGGPPDLRVDRINRILAWFDQHLK